MASRDQKLFDEVVSDALDILRLSARQRADTMRRLDKMSKELVKKLAAEPLNIREKRKVAKFLKEADKIIRGYYGGIQLELPFLGLAEAVAARTANTLQIVLGLPGLKLPTQDYFNSLASDVLIQGAPSKDWWAAQAERTRFRFAQQVRQGLANGETNQQIISRIVGKQGQPGIMEVARKDAAALVQTSVQTVANDARLATFRANADVVKGVRQVSTLDSHTSDICIAYSGAEWDLDGKPLKGSPDFNGGPPRHFNCRSVLVPITKTFRELGLDIDEREPTARASDEGPISAKTSFDEFLKRKGKAYQDEVLGVGRADLWRAGKITLRDLVAGDGRPLTLAELRRKAGLE